MSTEYVWWSYGVWTGSEARCSQSEMIGQIKPVDLVMFCFLKSRDILYFAFLTIEVRDRGVSHSALSVESKCQPNPDGREFANNHNCA